MSEPPVASPKPLAGEAMPQDEEPKTPMWLPAVGAALFVGVALWWAVTPPAASSAATETAAAAAAAPNPQGQATVPPPAGGAPSPAGLAGRPPPPTASVQQARIPMPSALPPELQKRVNDLRGKQQHP